MRRLLLKLPYGIASILILAVILFLTLTPDPMGAHDITLFPGFDKVAHFIMFFIAGCIFTLDVAKMRFPHRPRLDLFIAITLFGIVLGGVIELLQDAMQYGRDKDLIDFIADSLGSIAAFAICYYYLVPQLRIILKRGK
ncbi:MAG: hypothetical protein RSB34_02820 [Muribaculaceae bacterium]